MIQIYTGDGKGKTTAAAGLALRALGHGRRVLLVRFLKGEPGGEVAVLRNLPGVEIVDSGLGTVRDTPGAALLAVACSAAFRTAVARIDAGGIDLAIFDELNGAVQRSALPLAEVLELCRRCPAGTELVFTGRNAPPELLELADLVTEMRALRHPLQRGVAARAGIEF